MRSLGRLDLTLHNIAGTAVPPLSFQLLINFYIRIGMLYCYAYIIISSAQITIQHRRHNIHTTYIL